MHYSPIIAPVLASVIWLLFASLVAIPTFLRAYLAAPTPEEQQVILARGLPWGVREYPAPFSIVCLSLAYMGAGSGLACWLAWAFVMSWAAFKLPTPYSNEHLRCGASWGVNISMSALAIYAGIRIIRDMLAAYG